MIHDLIQEIQRLQKMSTPDELPIVLENQIKVWLEKIFMEAHTILLSTTKAHEIQERLVDYFNNILEE